MRVDPRLAALVALTLASPASAFLLTGMDWTHLPHPLSMPFSVNVASFPATVGSAAAVESALHDAQDLWRDEGLSAFAFTWGGVTQQTSFTNDRTLITQYSATAVAGTTLAVSQAWSVRQVMTDCDQRFYAANDVGPIDWQADQAGAGPLRFDLEHTAAHEYGHCAGLDHSSRASALMYGLTDPGRGPADRHLDPDDIAGLQAIYGPGPGAFLQLRLNHGVVAGQSHTFEITGADPGERVYLMVGPSGEGRGPCPPVLNGGAICLNIRGPVYLLAQGTANALGDLSLTASIPARFEGATLALQAGALRGPNNADTALSNPVSGLALPVGLVCPAGSEPDCGGACEDPTWIGDGNCDDGTPRPGGTADFNCDAHDGDGGDCP